MCKCGWVYLPMYVCAHGSQWFPSAVFLNYFKNFFICLHACVHACVRVNMHRDQKRASDALELQLQEIVSCPVWMLETGFRPRNAFNWWAVSPALVILHFILLQQGLSLNPERISLASLAIPLALGILCLLNTWIAGGLPWVPSLNLGTWESKFSLHIVPESNLPRIICLNLCLKTVGWKLLAQRHFNIRNVINVSDNQNLSYRDHQMGQQVDSAGKGTCHQAWRAESHSWDLHSEKRGPISTSCPPTTICLS